MNYKAKATGFKTYNRQYSTNVEYEYRGHTYEVEYANDWSYCVTPAKVQHEEAQEYIDNLIDNPKKDEPKEVRYEDTAEYGFKKFWEYVEDEEDEC